MAERITTDAAIGIMVSRIAKGYNPDRIVLFGSQARGDAAWDSDVDLLVVLPVCNDPRATAVSIRALLSDLPVGKDIIVTTPQELETRGKLASTILYQAMREGKSLYAR